MVLNYNPDVGSCTQFHSKHTYIFFNETREKLHSSPTDNVIDVIIYSI